MPFGVYRRKFHDKSWGRNQNSTGSKRPSYFCEHCKMSGHSVERCFKIHRYPQQKKKILKTRKFAAAAQSDDLEEGCINEGSKYGLTSEQFFNLMSLFEKVSKNEGDSSKEHIGSNNVVHLASTSCFFSHIYKTQWIVDSGAIDHICTDLRCFFNIKDISKNDHVITIPDGTKHKVAKIGNVHLSSNLILHNIL